MVVSSAPSTRTQAELIKALRTYRGYSSGQVMDAAADEIERLRAEVQVYKDKEAALVRMWHDPASQ